MMNSDVWIDTPSMGNEKIDSQHSQIAYLMKELEAHLHDELESEKTFYLLLSSLMLTITQHFRDEEILLEESGCPWLAEQVKDHTYFIEKLSGILAMEERGVPEQVVQFLKQWLQTHLHRLDLKCRSYLEDH